MTFTNVSDFFQALPFTAFLFAMGDIFIVKYLCTSLTFYLLLCAPPPSHSSADVSADVLYGNHLFDFATTLNFITNNRLIDCKRVLKYDNSNMTR